jgi:hypothetical protein
MHENDLQIPYDRCVEIDKEVDALLKEDKNHKLVDERKTNLITESKKSRHFAIYKWLGWNLMLEYLSGKVLWVLLFIPAFFLTSGSDAYDKVLNDISPTINDLIRTKMLNERYMIPTNVIDCPISIKQQLYEVIDNSSNYFVKKCGSGLYVCDDSFKGEMLDITHSKDISYLLDQLVEGEFYSITEIITDKQVKYMRGN